MNIDNTINNYPVWVLTERQLFDLELLLNGGFSPIEGFLGKSDYDSVVNEMRLNNGTLWPVPITLDVTKEFATNINENSSIALKNKEGFLLATMEVSDIWKPNLKKEAMAIYGSSDEFHPGVNYLFNIGYEYYLGGLIKKISPPIHYDYKKYRHTPSELRSIFNDSGWKKIIGFQTRNPLHRAHIEMTLKAQEQTEAKLLIHPSVGMTKPGDIDYYTRVRCYEHALKKYPNNSAMLSLLPLAMRMAGPREAMLHALIRKNYGCTHFIVGRDHAGPGNDSQNKPYYEPYDAQKLLLNFEDEIGLSIIPFKSMVYIPSEKKYSEIGSLKKKQKYLTLSGTQLRKLLDKGENIPNWFTYAEIAEELKKIRPPLNEQGFTVFFTGLSGAGKSTLAKVLQLKLMEKVDRPVTLLDGDIVRTHLSSELGFTKEHRSINIRRIGFVASEITKNKGIVVCAPIAPYEKDRQYNRQMISKLGGYIEVYVKTPIEKCEERDAKGLYELARKGKIKNFTGISDPYEIPKNVEIVIDSSSKDPEKLVDIILSKIIDFGYLKK
ncbi:MAG: adenylyltransferase [Candidatus Marinimicrobia bacterium]|nr:adenylyltransferase [Candidatus Neomarinimicrobiota bacterium]|tara:strand:+ start:12070 stop:13719 length:1650 start_codon:yes stop_codon:yes gene_type:complete